MVRAHPPLFPSPPPSRPVFYPWLFFKTPIGDMDPAKVDKDAIAAASQDAMPATPVQSTTGLPGPSPRFGWLTVRRSFAPHTSAAPASALSAESKPPSSTTDSSYTSLLRSAVRSSTTSTPAPPKEYFYAALKGSVLFLYESEAMAECAAVVDLQSHDVLLWPEGTPDGELYAKRNAIKLAPVRRPLPEEEQGSAAGQAKEIGGGSSATGAPVSSLDENGNGIRRAPSPMPHPSPWYIFVKSNTRQSRYLEFTASFLAHLSPILSDGGVSFLPLKT